MNWINRILRYQLNKRNKKKLKNKDFSLIANNCNGAFICHDLGLQFQSPFVNLWMTPEDYLKLLSRLREYLESELTFTKEEGITYPVGLLRDVKIYFQHYKSEEDAYDKWVQRLKRMNFENLFILLTETDGCKYELLETFDQLPYAKKAVLTHRAYPELKSAYCLSGFEEMGYVGKCYRYKGKFTGQKGYDDFDYVSWFNGGIE